MHCVRNINRDCITEMLKPVYAERALLQEYRSESETRRRKGEKVYLSFNDIECQSAHTSLMTLMEQDTINNHRISLRELPKKYHKLIKAKKGVIAHVKQCYKILYEEAQQQSKKQKDYHLLLKKNGKCEFPPMPLLESFEELESNDGDLFNKDEIDELYENETKADA